MLLQNYNDQYHAISSINSDSNIKTFFEVYNLILYRKLSFSSNQAI